MKLLDWFFRQTALKMAGVTLETSWRTLTRIGPAWAGFVSVKLGPNQDFLGGAVDESRRVQAIRCLMEALESVAITQSNLDLQSRTGLSANFSEESAKAGAYAELVERDALLYHWLSETPAREVDHPHPLVETARNLTQEGQLRVVQLSSADPGIVVCLAASRSPMHGCWHLGMGTGPSVSFASRKATLEWLASVHAHRARGDCPSKKSRDADLARHHLISMEPDVARLLELILGVNPSMCASSSVSFDETLIDSSSLRSATRFTRLKTLSPRYFVIQAQNKLLLPLHFSQPYVAAREFYLANPRVKSARERRAPGQFHPADRFLLHPFD